MAGETTRTLRWTSGSTPQLNPSKYVVKLYDIFVSSSGANPCLIMFNEGNAVNTNQKLYIRTDETTTNYLVCSSTNIYSLCEGITFEGGCYVQTGSGFGYASITYGLDMS